MPLQLQVRPARQPTAVGDAETRDDPAATDALDLPRLGTVEDLGTLLVSSPIHEVIAIQSSGDRGWLKQVLEDCDYFRVRLRIVPEALLVGTLRDLKLMFRTEPLRLPEVVLAPRHLETDVLFLKRLIDIVVSAGLLVLLSPLLAMVALAIKLGSPDLPVFYPWRVIGLKGCPFTGYKFRTMVGDADQQRGDLAARNEMQGPVFKVKNDPRVTPFGRWLRKFSVNELPQLWSVLKGDMSLVGPRPAFRHELERYELWHKRKLCVKPGITCLWQVSGRNQISDFDDWVRLDLQYIDEWSLGLDLRILARTAWAVATGTGS
jgi:lipopolysaccharide/colanic/teichoic acid biosynthesis glycosyltransferase